MLSRESRTHVLKFLARALSYFFRVVFFFVVRHIFFELGQFQSQIPGLSE